MKRNNVVSFAGAALLLGLLLSGCSMDPTESSYFAGGNGTMADPYQIATAEQFDAIHGFKDKHYKLVADIDLSAYADWAPIGTFGAYAAVTEADNPNLHEAFTGSLDGNGHTISDLTIYENGDMLHDYVGTGLFGCISNAGAQPAVQNLTLTNANVSGDNAVGAVVGYLCEGNELKNISLVGENQIAGTMCVGGIVGGNNGGTLDGCSAEATVVLSSTGKKGETENIVLSGTAQCSGILIGGAFGGEIKNCSAQGTLLAEGEEIIGIGGLTGSLQNVSACTNCTVTATIQLGKAAHAVGGLAGFGGTFTENAPLKIKNCQVDVQILGQPDSTHIGGIMGSGLYMNSTQAESAFMIADCSVSGAIKGIPTAGTIAGRAEGSTEQTNHVDITIDGKAGSEIGIANTLIESLE